MFGPGDVTVNEGNPNAPPATTDVDPVHDVDYSDGLDVDDNPDSDSGVWSSDD